MNIDYFKSINNSYLSKSKQETELYILNKHVNNHFTDSIDYHIVKKNGQPFELLIIKDTDGNTTHKKIKSRPNEFFNLGDYIEWNNQIWIVTKTDPDSKTYNSGYMYLCNTCLRWQNKDGDIIERWAYVEDYTKYSSGVYDNGTVIVGDNQYGAILPIDEETAILKRDMRFAVDVELADIPDIYKLTNRKANISNNEHFGRGATLTVVLSLTAFNPEVDKLVKNNDDKMVWICNYKEPNTTPPKNYPANGTTAPQLVTATITGGSTIKYSRAKTWTLKFKDSTNNNITQPFSWNISSSFNVPYTINNDKIQIKITDENLIGSHFLLQTIDTNGDIINEQDIEIIPAF